MERNPFRLLREAVEKPCEAATFEEAFRKNKLRLEFERLGALDLVEAGRRDGEELSGVDPDFWRGCELANSRAWFILSEEMGECLGKVASRLAAAGQIPGRGKGFNSGLAAVTAAWITALKTNDPQAIVYW